MKIANIAWGHACEREMCINDLKCSWRFSKRNNWIIVAEVEEKFMRRLKENRQYSCLVILIWIYLIYFESSKFIWMKLKILKMRWNAFTKGENSI